MAESLGGVSASDFLELDHLRSTTLTDHRGAAERLDVDGPWTGCHDPCTDNGLNVLFLKDRPAPGPTESTQGKVRALLLKTGRACTGPTPVNTNSTITD